MKTISLTFSALALIGLAIIPVSTQTTTGTPGSTIPLSKMIATSDRRS